MKMRFYYFGVLLALFAPLGALCEPGGRLAIDTLKEDLLKIKQLVGLTIATPALDAVVVGAVEPGIEEIKAALEDAEACITAAVQSITQEELLHYAEKLEAYWAEFFDAAEQELADESTRSRKCKKLCQLFAKKACICDLRARDVTIFGTLIVDGVRIPSNDPLGRIIADNTDSPDFACLTFQKSRAGAAVQDGDTIGCINFQGFDGAAFSTGATIEAQVDGTPGVGDMPGRIIFSTSPDGTATPVERLRIDNAGLATFANSIDLPNTLSAAVGMFSKEGTRFLHNFGTDSTFLGVAAGNLTLTGFSNTGVGVNVLDALTTGALNTGVGTNALTANTTGNQNSAGGVSALAANTTGSSNTAFGVAALLSNTTGNANTAVGVGALAANTDGDFNVAVGITALNNNTIGSNNVAIGDSALLENVSGDSNIAIGLNALGDNTSGFRNVAVGSEALALNTTFGANVAVGYFSLDSLVTGSFNVAIGYSFETGGDITAAQNCTFVGANATAVDGLTNSMALGSNALVDVSNKVRVGDGNITVIEGQVAFTASSDERLKHNIQDCPLGLVFINKLKALKYDKECGKNSVPELGFSAQKVCAAAESCGCDFPGVSCSKSEGHYYMRYNDLFAPIVKAIQELSAEVDCLKAKNDRLEHALVRAGISL